MNYLEFVRFWNIVLFFLNLGMAIVPSNRLWIINIFGAGLLFIFIRGGI